MDKLDYLKSVEIGVEHLRGREFSENALRNLQNGTGSREGCLRSLCLGAAPQSLLGWFEHGDLARLKYWAYVVAKLQRMIAQNEPDGWWPAYKHLYALLSNDLQLIEWYGNNVASYFAGEDEFNKNNPRHASFHGYQAMLAIQGQWSELESRSREAIKDPQVSKSKYGIDFSFYLGLAQGDIQLMERTIEEIAGPLASIRNFEQAFGFTCNLISTHGVVYSKIAYLHGFELDIESPWVPKPWLSMTPMESYEDPWDFMKKFDIWEPFEGQWARWSPSQT